MELVKLITIMDVMSYRRTSEIDNDYRLNVLS